MKKDFIIWNCITLIILSTLVAAVPMPLPLAGEVRIQNMPAPTGADITIKSITYGTVLATNVDANGHFQFNLANAGLSSGWYEVAVVSCSDNPQCIKSVFVQNDPVKLIFDIEPTVIGDTIYTYVCSDGSKVAVASQCPVKAPDPVVTTPPTPPEDDDDEKTQTQHWLTIVIETLAGIFAIAGGWKFYAGKFKHYHRGLSGYHDPNTRHNNPKYRHTRWNDGVWACIKECALIQKGIDLVGYREEQEAQEDE